MEFNLYSSLLLLPFSHGLLFSVLLWVRFAREQRLSDAFLAALLMVFVLDLAHWMLGFGGWYDTHDARTTFVFYFPFSQKYLLGPLALFYFNSLTNAQFALKRRHLAHFAPALIVLCAYAYGFMEDVVWEHAIRKMPFPDHFGTKGDKAQGNLPILTPFDWAWPVVLLTYLLLILRRFRLYRRYVEDFYSDVETLRLDWLRYVLMLFALVVTLLIGFSLVDVLVPEGLSYVQKWYKFLAWALPVYGLSLGGYYTRFPENKAPEFHPGEVEPSAQEAPSDTDRKLLERLLSHMDVRRPYLNPELTLRDLARQMNTRDALLSQTINQQLGKNFNDFVNGFRVEAVKIALQQPSNAHFNLLAVAFDCGFNSKATFNRAFKKHTGIAPSDWQKTSQNTLQDSINGFETP